MLWNLLPRSALVMLGLIASCLWAEAPSSKPILRLETGTHLGKVSRIAADASGRWLATASEDKTLRIWDLRTRSLAQTLRVPIGNGDEGELYACAMSPDGGTIATGGWARDAAALYLFDRVSGSLRASVPSLPDTIHNLAFARDGRRLALCLGPKGGLRVLRMPSLETAFQDPDCRDRIVSADFDPSGRLATASWDGRIRLYDSEGRKTADVVPPGGQRPIVVRFSPDGTRLAAGFGDVSSVPVLSGTDLSQLFLADTAGLKGGVFALAWQGDQLVAESRLPPPGQGPGHPKPGVPLFDPEKVLRTWSRGGQGSHWDLTLPLRNQVTDLLSLPDGSLAVSSFDGWGVVSKEGVPWVQLNAAGDFRERLLSIDAGGQSLAFSLRFPKGEPWRFELTDRRLVKAPSPSLRPPRLEAPGVKVLHWWNQPEPYLNGKPLPLKPNENARALAIQQDGRGFLLGADRTLYAFDRNGTVRWRRPVPGIAWAVNLTQDDAIGIVAYGDGTIRWHRMQDGRELLALYVHPETRRWVLWTPSGHFDCSPGAEDLMGWHLNRGKDQAADFFPAGRFRGKYFQPERIDQALEAQGPGKSAGSIPEAAVIEDILPPVVRILSPERGAAIRTQSVPVTVRIHHPRDLPVDEVWATVDGRPQASRGLAIKAVPKAGELTLEVSVPARDCLISILARSGKAISEAAIVPVKWAGPAGADPRGRMNLLAVGVSAYGSASLDLGFAGKDAQDVTSRLLVQKGRLYEGTEARILLDAKATKNAILGGLEWLSKATGERDTAVVFLAGHGMNDSRGQFFFLPYGADLERAEASLVSDAEIQRALVAIPGKVVVFLDACHSGDVVKRNSITRFVNELASAENGIVVFTASTGRQLSLESAAWRNGAFTKALTEGLDGQADLLKKGRITVSSLDTYLADRVPTLTDGRQTPTVIKPMSIPDFALALTR